MSQHYWNRYLKFIEWCDSRPLFPGEYTEKHHIMPRSFDGDNSSDNLIKLSAREHFIAHWLLARATDAKSMWITLHFMCRYYTDKEPKSWEYALCRIAASKTAKGKNNPRYGKPCSEATKKKIGDANRGRKHSLEARQKMSESRKGSNHFRFGVPLSEEHKRKLSRSNRGRKQSNSFRKKRSLATQGSKNPKYDHTVYNFCHIETGELYSGTQYSFYTKYGLRAGNVNSMVRGKDKSVKGWILLGKLNH